MIVRYTLMNRHLSLGQAAAPAPAPAPAAQPEAVTVPSGPKPMWANEGGHDLTRTLLAVGTVAALAIAGIVFLK